MRRRLMALVTAVVAMLAIFCGPQPAWAQPRGGPGSMFARLDANGNGVIEPSEVPDRFRPFFERMAKRAGLDPRRPIKIDQLRGAMESARSSFGGRDRGRDRGRRDWGRRDRDRRDDERRRDEQRRDEKKDEEGGVPGFGVEEPLVLGFGAAFDAESDDAMLQRTYTDRILREVDSFLSRYDKNKNGILDPAEWKGVPWRGDPRKSDTNGDGRLTRAEYAARLAQRHGKESFRDRGNSSRSSSSSRSTSSFSRSSTSRGSSGTASRGRSSSTSQGDREKFRKFAESIMKRYDKNENRVLDKDEVGTWAKADKNRNGKVTMDELIVWLRTFQRSGSSASGGSKQREGSTGRPEFYRYRPPHERLSSDVPDWFKEKDKNADGQVAMAEYATRWTDATLEEFNGYDRNGDGMITPAEALKPREE